MTIEKKSGLFYEILIRGVHDGAAEELGGFSGAHYIEAEAVVDTETGEVLSFRPGVAVSLPQDKVSGLLGEQFANFEASFRTLSENLDAERRKSQSLQLELEEANSRVETTG